MGLLFVLYTLFPQSLISVSNPWRSFCANMAIFKGTQPLLLFEVLRTKDTVSGAPSLVWTSLTLRTLRTTLIVCLKKIHTYFCCSENWRPGRRQRNERTLNVNQLSFAGPTWVSRLVWCWGLREDFEGEGWEQGQPQRTQCPQDCQEDCLLEELR